MRESTIVRYIVRIVANPSDCPSLDEKHRKLVSGLKDLSGEWGIVPGEYPMPEFGNHFTAQWNIGKSLRRRRVQGVVNYRMRNALRDNSDCDDYIAITFSAKPEEVNEFAGGLLSMYVELFDAYLGFVANEEFIFEDAGGARGRNLRESLPRFYPYLFVANGVSRRLLGGDASDIAERLAPVASVRQIAAGILITAKAAALDFDSEKWVSDEMSRRLRSEA